MSRRGKLTVPSDSVDRGELILARVRDHLAGSKPSGWGWPTWVDGWVEESGTAIRLVYDQVGEERRLGYRENVSVVTESDTVAGLVLRVLDAICEPLGRQADLLVEEQGAWWWGDGYPGIDEHPVPLMTQEELAAQIEAEFGSSDAFEVESGDPRPSVE